MFSFKRFLLERYERKGSIDQPSKKERKFSLQPSSFGFKDKLSKRRATHDGILESVEQPIPRRNKSKKGTKIETKLLIPEENLHQNISKITK